MAEPNGTPMPRIVALDFANPAHTDAVYHLAKRNQFYEDDIYVVVNKKLSPASLLKLRQSMPHLDKAALNAGANTIQATVRAKKYFGYILIANNNKGNDAVVGFNINIDLKCGRTPPDIATHHEMCFLLTDKNYRQKGYGKLLLRHYLKDRVIPTLSFRVIVKVEDVRLISFYEDNGFELGDPRPNDDGFYICCCHPGVCKFA